MMSMVDIFPYRTVIRNKITMLFSKQTYYTKLAYHGWLVLLSLVLFTALSWTMYYLVAPFFIRKTRRRRRVPPQSVEKGTIEYEQMRLKWGHMMVSMIHALIVTGWTTYTILKDPGNLSLTAESRVFGHTRSLGYMFAVSLGYFSWDVCCCAKYLRMYSRGVLIHALLGFFGILTTFVRYPAPLSNLRRDLS